MLGLVAVDVVLSPKFQLREAMVPSESVELSVNVAVSPLVLLPKFATGGTLPLVAVIVKFGRDTLKKMLPTQLARMRALVVATFGTVTDALPEFGQSTPLGRAGQPTELAPAYVFLASSESSYVIGETLNVNGGSPSP